MLIICQERVAVYMVSLATTLSFLRPQEPIKTAIEMTDYSLSWVVFLIAAMVQAKLQRMNVLDGFIVFMASSLPLINLVAIPSVTMVFGLILAPKNTVDSERNLSSSSEPTRSSRATIPHIRTLVLVHWFPGAFEWLLRAIYFILWTVWYVGLTDGSFVSDGTQAGCPTNQNLVIWRLGSGIPFEEVRWGLKRVLLPIVTCFAVMYGLYDLVARVASLHIGLMEHYYRQGELIDKLKLYVTSGKHFVDIARLIHPERVKTIGTAQRQGWSLQGFVKRWISSVLTAFRITQTVVLNLPYLVGEMCLRFLQGIRRQIPQFNGFEVRWNGSSRNLALVLLYVLQVAMVIFGVLVQVTIIAVVEGTITTNNVQRDFNVWTYGQVSALALGIYQTLHISVRLVVDTIEPGG
ncbi:hypothetical protein RSAG8_05908, partial [Rhizoctonia solani AG-8 WAC10335]